MPSSAAAATATTTTTTMTLVVGVKKAHQQNVRPSDIGYVGGLKDMSVIILGQHASCVAA